MTDPRIGTTLDGRYQIVDRLAAGGMGVVYRGERIGLGRGVAIKFLHAHMAADSSFLKRFAIEARAMARLQHPHCAAVMDYGVEGEEPYVVMDLVAGESLRSVLDRGRLPAPRALSIMRQILSGLAHAHEQGITHRDIKPDNVMVDASGSFGDQVRILDFGLAKLRENASGLTTGFVVGTPSYMAPEQTLAMPVDERTDIYACGVVLFEMLTGEKPFQAEESVDVLMMHRKTPPPRLIEKAPDVRFSDELEAAVLQAMAKDPAHRFASAAAFATALEHVPEGATRPSAAMAAVTPHTPRPELVGSPRPAALGTAPTEWSPSQVEAPGPAAQGSATEHLDSAQFQAMSSHVQPAYAPGVGGAGGPGVTVAGHAVTPQPWTAPAPPAGGLDSGSLALPTGPSAQTPAPAPPAPGRKPWIIGGAAAGVVGLLVVVALVAGKESAGSATGDTGEPEEHVAEARDEGPEIEADPMPPEEMGEDTAYTGDLALAAAYLEQGQHRRARDLLERLRRYDANNADVHYLLGRAYLDELWVNDGLDAFRDAIALDPSYRSNTDLIESAAAGLGSDSQHFAVSRFLLRDIGPAARPALEGLASGHHREEVRERASRALSQLP
ncbi:MAG TPA: protein kinase [Haliangium sp.]|nr:protein kinase [Haliangium sp.]